jgi:glutathione peroxidase-family protein
MPTAIQSSPLKKIGGEAASLADYAGKVVLVVNVASKCGLTPQYEGLEKIYEKYAAEGLVVAGFPANDFMEQEPGSNAEIAQFCTMNFGVKFPIFEKVVVTGAGKHPLYAALTAAQRLPRQAHEPGHPRHRTARGAVELREVSPRAHRRSCGPLCAAHPARRSGAASRRRSGIEEELVSSGQWSVASV